MAYSFSASRFIVTVDFTDKSRLGTLVRISSKEGEPELTLEEAPQIMMSLGLNNPQKIAQDPTAEDQNVIIEPADDERQKID